MSRDVISNGDDTRREDFKRALTDKCNAREEEIPISFYPSRERIAPTRGAFPRNVETI